MLAITSKPNIGSKFSILYPFCKSITEKIMITDITKISIKNLGILTIKLIKNSIFSNLKVLSVNSSIKYLVVFSIFVSFKEEKT